MLHITSHWGDKNQNHDDTTSDPLAWLFKRKSEKKVLGCGEIVHC